MRRALAWILAGALLSVQPGAGHCFKRVKLKPAQPLTSRSARLSLGAGLNQASLRLSGPALRTPNPGAAMGATGSAAVKLKGGRPVSAVTRQVHPENARPSGSVGHSRDGDASVALVEIGSTPDAESQSEPSTHEMAVRFEQELADAGPGNGRKSLLDGFFTGNSRTGRVAAVAAAVGISLAVSALGGFDDGGATLMAGTMLGGIFFLGTPEAPYSEEAQEMATSYGPSAEAFVAHLIHKIYSTPAVQTNKFLILPLGIDRKALMKRLHPVVSEDIEEGRLLLLGLDELKSKSEGPLWTNDRRLLYPTEGQLRRPRGKTYAQILAMNLQRAKPRDDGYIGPDIRGIVAPELELDQILDLGGGKIPDGAVVSRQNSLMVIAGIQTNREGGESLWNRGKEEVARREWKATGALARKHLPWTADDLEEGDTAMMEIVTSAGVSYKTVEVSHVGNNAIRIGDEEGGEWYARADGGWHEEARGGEYRRLAPIPPGGIPKPMKWGGPVRIVPNDKKQTQSIEVMDVLHLTKTVVVVRAR